MKKYLIVLFLIPIFLSACSHIYKPSGPREAAFFEKSDRTTSPGMVTKMPENQRRKKVVGWAGLIKKVDLVKVDERDMKATFLIEHRNFDWVTDRGIQRQIYFLSKRGEGDFAAEVIFGKSDKVTFEDLKADFMSQNEIGNMIVVYGTPSVDKDKLVLMNAMARPIPKGLFHTNWDY